MGILIEEIVRMLPDGSQIACMRPTEKMLGIKILSDLQNPPDPQFLYVSDEDCEDSLCLKSGNVCVLRGGKEAYASACAIVKSMRGALARRGLPETLVNIVEDTSRRSAEELMTARGLVDLLIPRGGAGLIRACVENAKVPCIQTGTGICHI